jgi:c-di-AMP phosphodiesterase-like protein
MASINFSPTILQSVVSTALQSLGLTSNTTAATATQPDNSQLSPFAQLMSTLKQLQQSNPTQYAQVTQQISTNLQQAAQTATSNGNTAAASQLNQLATDFSNASQSGQLPNVQALAQALGGGGHHHHHASEASSSNSDPTANSSTSASQSISQLLAAFQSNASQSASTTSTDPMAIIMNTLSSAGISNQPS